MEKEFLALLLAVLHFREYLESVPLCYVLSDSQSVLWALNSQNETLKLSRHLIKLFELNFNLIITHIEGKKNAIADFLSRIYLVDDIKKGDGLKPKMAQHVTSPFPVLSVVTQQDIVNAFAKEQIVTPCKNPEIC